MQLACGAAGAQQAKVLRIGVAIAGDIPVAVDARTSRPHAPDVPAEG